MRALRGVSFDLRHGEVHALVGENGAGKSTLIKIITGAVAPDSGSLGVSGRAVPHMQPALSRALGIAAIYQQPALFPHLTVAENIALARERAPGWRRVDWKRRRPVHGNVTGGLSGPAIKPLALRLVWQVARHVAVPVVGVGGIATLDDVMEFLVAGASAVQLGTVNFYDPTAAQRIVGQLPEALAQLGAGSVREVVGTLRA